MTRIDQPFTVLGLIPSSVLSVPEFSHLDSHWFLQVSQPEPLYPFCLLLNFQLLVHLLCFRSRYRHRYPYLFLPVYPLILPLSDNLNYYPKPTPPTLSPVLRRIYGSRDRTDCSSRSVSTTLLFVQTFRNHFNGLERLGVK